jgi:transposase
MSRKIAVVPLAERLRVVLAVLSGELSMAEAARRHGVADGTVAKWRDRFIEAGKAGLADGIPGAAEPGGNGRAAAACGEQQLKLALAEQMVQLRIWQKGAEYVSEVPSTTSKH